MSVEDNSSKQTKEKKTVQNNQYNKLNSSTSSLKESILSKNNKGEVTSKKPSSVISSSLDEEQIAIEFEAYKDMMGIVDYDIHDYELVSNQEDKNLLIAQ